MPETRVQLRDRLLEDLKDAMRKGDILRRETIRFLRAGVVNQEIERRRPLSDAEVLEVVSRLVKQHRESIEEFKKGRRDDLVAKEEAELAILLAYMPPQLTREDMRALAELAIQEVGATGPRDQGKVMSRLAPQLKGKADMGEASSIVQEMLSR